MSEPYDTLDKRWKSTCKAILGQEVGGLDQYMSAISAHTNPIISKKSTMSGKPVSYLLDFYHPDSKWISLDEIDYNKRYEPIDLEKAKTIDSLARMCKDRIFYSGNVVIGNSDHVLGSSNIMDCFYMLNCTQIGNSKYLTHCTLGRECEDCFGGNAVAESSACIRCHETTRDKRSFELWMSQSSSECYYSFGLRNCSDCIFCFNLRNKRYCVGNAQVSKEEYETVKHRLLEQVVRSLLETHSVPSMYDLISKSKQEKLSVPPLPQEKEEKTDKAVVERAFASTCKMVLGQALGGEMDEYAGWLMAYIHPTEFVNSCLSGKRIALTHYSNYNILPHERMVSLEEAYYLGERLSLDKKDALGLDLANAHEKIGKLVYIASEWSEGKKSNLTDCNIYIDAADCYRVAGAIYSKSCGYCFWPKSSENAFGSDTLFVSNACIHCYYSTQLTRCFEMDACSNCSDSMYCHNCENLSDCLFCFNVKGMRYAIGNVVVGRERFMQVKKRVQEEIVEKLGKERKLQSNIFNVGAVGKIRGEGETHE